MVSTASLYASVIVKQEEEEEEEGKESGNLKEKNSIVPVVCAKRVHF